MSQDNKKSFVMYQGDGSNNVFSVPMTKGKYGTISVAFVRRGLDQYEYNPDTWGLNGGLFAWDLSGAKVYTDTATPAIGATIYDQYGVDTGDAVTAVGGATITVNTNVYTRDTLHDVDENTVLTWTGDTLQVGDYIVIERTTTRTQPFEFQNNQKHVEKSDDNLERQIQEVADKVDNALLVDPTHTIDSNKMNPVEWMQTILRSVDKSVRGFRYLNGWLDYSLDDPNIADVDKTWAHLLNADNIKSVRERKEIEDGEEHRWVEYLDQNGQWQLLVDSNWDARIEEIKQIADEAKQIADEAKDVADDAKEIAEGIDDKAQSALDNSVEAVERVDELEEKIIVKSDIVPTASADLVGSIYQYVGATNSSYTHGYIYECKAIPADALVFSPDTVSCSWTDLSAFLQTETANYDSVVAGTMTYVENAELWRATFTDANGDTVLTYQQYTGDWENIGFVFSQTFEDGDVVSFVRHTDSTQIWERIDVQPNHDEDIAELYDEVANLKGLGRFLSVWNCATGLAETNPPESPYEYRTGDYFLVGTVGTTNYKPDGAIYTIGVASTVVETNEVKVNDVYIYDGTNWKLQANSQREYSFSGIVGSPYDNTNLSNALNTKADRTYVDSSINNTMPLDSMLVPDLDKRTPIASYEFDSSGATYKPLLRIPNNHSNPQDIPVLNAVFRITSTRTGVKTVCDCVLSSLRTTNGPLVLMRHYPGSTSSTTTGFDYVRTVYPKVLNNGYDWYFELRNPTNDSVHTKVDVYSSDTGITWIADGTISTFNSSNQNQTAVALTTNNNLMWSITMPWTVSTANSAGYINSYLNKFISGSLPVMGASANAQSLVLLGKDKKFYPMSSTTVAIDPWFGAVVLGGAVASGSAVSWTNISSKRRTGTTEIPHNTLTIGESCYLRCTTDASGNIYSDNYVDTQMSAGYTWLYIGQAENATTIEVNTEGSKFYTLDANGNLTQINGKKIATGAIAYSATDGITLDGTTFKNSGVRAVSTGSTNGTISVNTNGTTADVAVAGLGSAAFTPTTDYATAAQGALADTAVQPADLTTLANTSLSNLDSTGVGKLGPLVYQVIGYVVNSATAGSSVSAYGICRVELYPNGLAIVDFNLHFTASGTSGDFSWGLNRDILHNLNANIPIITPISGTCSYYDASGIYSGTLNGNAGTLGRASQFWAFGRLYDTAGNIGGWAASQMSANIKVVGRCYGTYTV